MSIDISIDMLTDKEEGGGRKEGRKEGGGGRVAVR